MKKLFLTATLCATFCFVFECGAEIVSGDKCGDNCTWTFDTDTGKLTISGTGDMYNFPQWQQDTVVYKTDWYSDTPWVNLSSSIHEVVVENGITRIGQYSFWDTAVTKVSLPESLTTLGLGAFQYSDLSEVSLPSNLTSIEHAAFHASDVKNLVIPETVTSIDSYALRSISMEKIVFEGNIELNKNMFGDDLPEPLNSIYCDASNESCNALKSDADFGSKIQTYEKDKSGALKIGEDYYATANDLMNNNKCAGGLTDSCITAALNNKAQNLKSKGKCSDDAECEALVNADYNGEILEVGGKKYASLQDLYDGNEIVQEPVYPAIEPTGDNGGSTGEVSPVAEGIFNRAERGKRIYTVQEAKDAAGKKNKVMIRYK